MGLADKGDIQHIEDALGNITNVLVTTGAIASDPTGGKPNLLYYDGILRDLHDEGFHPGIDVENAHDENAGLPPLTDEQWQELEPIGQLNVPALSFSRGTATLTGASTESLDELIEKLKTWKYYLLVRGNSTSEGDPQANADLAAARAQAVQDYLVAHGIDSNRVHAVAGAPGTESSVTFVLGQPSY
jgi:outer membrane protein OmpA-like peptidoglycan-associated protein